MHTLEQSTRCLSRARYASLEGVVEMHTLLSYLWYSFAYVSRCSYVQRESNPLNGYSKFCVGFFNLSPISTERFLPTFMWDLQTFPHKTLEDARVAVKVFVGR